MEKARDSFIDLLISYRKIKAHDITVVFDGHKSGAGTEHMSVSGGVKIIYSRLGERADDVIKRIVSNERREWIVVSNDRDIVNHAWAANSIPIPSERFFELISKQAGRSTGHSEKTMNEFQHDDSEDDGYSHTLKGNPRQPSKKEKAIRRALGKL